MNTKSLPPGRCHNFKLACVPTDITLKYVNQKMTKLKEEIDKCTTTVFNFNMLLLIPDEKLVKLLRTLNIINNLNLMSTSKISMNP